jgi:hypothetical protein
LECADRRFEAMDGRYSDTCLLSTALGASRFFMDELEDEGLV